MENNYIKYKSYTAAFNVLKDALKNDDLPRCIAAVAVCESVIADRLQSFLKFKTPTLFLKRGKEVKHVSTSHMIRECLKYFPNYRIEIRSKHGRIDSESLFDDLLTWLSCRNDICHSIVKSEPGYPTVDVDEFYLSATRAAKEGIKLSKLTSKWHKQQLCTTKHIVV